MVALRRIHGYHNFMVGFNSQIVPILLPSYLTLVNLYVQYLVKSRVTKVAWLQTSSQSKHKWGGGGVTHYVGNGTIGLEMWEVGLLG